MDLEKRFQINLYLTSQNSVAQIFVRNLQRPERVNCFVLAAEKKTTIEITCLKFVNKQLCLEPSVLAVTSRLSS